MTITYGVAGSFPLSEYPARMNIMLMNAVQAAWDANVVVPPSSEILFLPTWFSGQKDIEIIFRQSFYDQPYWGRSTDWGYQLTIETIDVHVGVRAIAEGDQEPLFLSSVLQGLERIIAINCRTLIPNAWLTVESVMQGSVEKADDIQSFWHSLMKVSTYHYKCKVETP